MLERVGAVCLMGVLSFPAAGQVVKDTVLLNFFGTDAAVAKWKKSQKNAYSFDHLLQGPAVAKHYKDKKFGDHLFLEGGLNLVNNYSHGLGTKMGSIKPWAYAGIGDWVTPHHGWRISGQAGRYDLDGRHSAIAGVSVDYLLNINAIAAEKYDRPQTFEFYGLTGVDFFLSRHNGNTDQAYGYHVGLHAQANLGSYTYLFLEPRVGVYSKELFHGTGWRNYVLASNFIAGLGYRLAPVDLRKKQYNTSGSFLDNTFFSLSTGLTFLMNLGGSAPRSEKLGAVAGFHVGKWFDPYSAVRLGMNVSMRRQPYADDVKAGTLSLGYMWNMHNTFGGYNPDRKFWINTVADVTASLSTDGHGKKSSIGFGGGLQPNVHLGKGVDFYIEPRVDFYSKDFYSNVASWKNVDVAGSVMAGLVFRQGLNSKEQIDRNLDFEQKSWFDHTFIDLALGGSLPITRQAGKKLYKHFGPSAYAGVGKWFNATSGARVWGEVAKHEDVNSSRFDAINYGVDYLWNLSNALHGYNPERHAELIAFAGINGMSKLKSGKFYLGADAGFKGLLHLNDMVGLYVEPQMRFYSSKVMPASSFLFSKMDMVGSLMAGVQFTMNGYRASGYQEEYEDNERNSFFSMAAGAGTSADAPSAARNYGIVGRLSYGHWYSPTSAWRLNLGGIAKPKTPYRYASLTAGADYMADITALAYGYNAERVVNLRGIAGINLGADYKTEIKDPMHFVADVHLGGQLAVAVGSRNELYVEPQAAYVMGGKPTTNNSQRVTGSVMLGLNHKLKSTEVKSLAPVEAGVDEFVSFSAGTGFHTNAIYNKKMQKLTMDFDVAYGRWINGLSGYRVGLTNTTVKRAKGQGKQNITSLHADYMVNMLTLAGGDLAMDAKWVLNGIAGVSLNLGSAKKFDTTFAPGAQLSVQAGYKFTPNWELYAEPTGVLMGKKIWKHNSYPVVLQTRMMIGTKYHF